jgi:Family of unknown function (DUF6515)
MKGNAMQTSLKKLALTGSVAALLLAMPVSIDLGRSSATDSALKIAGIGLTVDTAQARVGRPATPGSVAGVSRRTTRRTVNRITPAVRPAYVRPAAVGAVAVGAAAATAVAVGTTVATLPEQCTTVVVDGVAYRRCGETYYRASGGSYVVVNPPR